MENKEKYAKHFENLKLADKIKYEKELTFNKEKVRQTNNSMNSMGSFTNTNEMDEFFKKRIKNFSTNKVINFKGKGINISFKGEKNSKIDPNKPYITCLTLANLTLDILIKK